MAMVDPNGNSIKISSDGLAKLDGVPIFRVVARKDGIYLEFVDRDRMRSNCRGSRYVEVALDAVVAVVNASASEAKTEG